MFYLLVFLLKSKANMQDNISITFFLILFEIIE